jgi:RNase P subunit RPR2
MIVAKEEIEFIRLLQNQGIYFCPDCHAPTQGTFLNNPILETFTIAVIACTKCSWCLTYQYETKSISNR